MDVVRILQLALALIVGIIIGFYGLRELPGLLQSLSISLGSGAVGALIVVLWRWDHWG